MHTHTRTPGVPALLRWFAWAPACVTTRQPVVEERRGPLELALAMCARQPPRGPLQAEMMIKEKKAREAEGLLAAIFKSRNRSYGGATRRPPSTKRAPAPLARCVRAPPRPLPARNSARLLKAAAPTSASQPHTRGRPRGWPAGRPRPPSPKP